MAVSGRWLVMASVCFFSQLSVVSIFLEPLLHLQVVCHRSGASGGTPVKRVCHDPTLWRQQLVAPAGCLDMQCVAVVKVTDNQEELSPPSSCIAGEMSVIIAILTRAVPRFRTLFPAEQHPPTAPATAQEPQAVCALEAVLEESYSQ
ncbi:uncharacterized protein LOC117282071 [Cryptotermes secundus]|uniref:uncharacterized protein LOC117282071 n=1 Tax=Cryptotermes secundus TaxID=105785 RepID=UPI001454D2DE|nr:uncharacterized protein LOC117282071 [Cryptotermes secundus]